MRAVKEMSALKKLGHQVTLIYEGLGCSVEQGYGSFWDQVIQIPNNSIKGEFYFRRLLPSIYKKYIRSLCELKKFDIIHSFSMPDTLAVAAIRYSNIPVVFDSRDVSSGMDGILLEELQNPFLNNLQSYIYGSFIRKFEREANEKSCGRIYVSQEMKNYISSIYKINHDRTIVLPNYQSESFISNTHLDKLSDKDKCVHLVYVGNILFDDFHRTIKAIKKIGVDSVHFHIYPVGDQIIIDDIKSRFGTNFSIHFHKSLAPKDLAKELTQYDFGLTPRPPDRNPLNNGFALPNKLFDYLTAGLKIAARNTDSISRFVRDNKVGFTYNTIEELVKKLLNDKGNYKIYPERFIMENHINKVSNLYISISKGP
jgi:hypothetical protein